MASSLSQLVNYSNHLLSHADFPDYPGALNGLQLENNGSVHRIAAAVDANLLTIQNAIRVKADLLIVHHGIGWNPLCPITEARYQWMKSALQHNLAIYSSHLPLDAHPKLGNNHLFAKALGYKKMEPFFEYKGVSIGCQIKVDEKRDSLIQKIEKITKTSVVLMPFGPSKIRRLGIVTGGAGNELAQAAASGLDTFITGEGNHWTYSAAQELKLNVIYAGHYATETFGVKALAKQLSEKYKLPWSFIHCPSGL